MHLRISIRWSVSPSIRLSHIYSREYQSHQVKARVGHEKSYVIPSSYNDFVIMSAHRWPYGPCYGIGGDGDSDSGSWAGGGCSGGGCIGGSGSKES